MLEKAQTNHWDSQTTWKQSETGGKNSSKESFRDAYVYQGFLCDFYSRPNTLTKISSITSRVLCITMRCQRDVKSTMSMSVKSLPSTELQKNIFWGCNLHDYSLPSNERPKSLCAVSNEHFHELGGEVNKIDSPKQLQTI